MERLQTPEGQTVSFKAIFAVLSIGLRLRPPGLAACPRAVVGSEIRPGWSSLRRRSGPEDPNLGHLQQFLHVRRQGLGFLHPSASIQNNTMERTGEDDAVLIPDVRQGPFGLIIVTNPQSRG